MLKNIEALLITSSENQRYFTGFTGSTGILVVAPEKSYFFTNPIYARQARQETKGVKIIEVPLGAKLLDQVVELIKKERIFKIGFEEENLTVKTLEELWSKLPEIEFIPVSIFLEDLRAVKTKSELNFIEKAIQIAKRAFEKVKPLIKPGISERAVANALEYHLRREGGEKSAFDIIVASGARASFPHAKASDKIIRKGEIVMIDWGVVYRGYNADLTRTVIIGPPTHRQKRVLGIIQKAQATAIQKVKAGVKCKLVDQAARKVVEKSGYKKYFGHGLGHGIGLKVHEYPKISVDSQDVLKAGMVITLEPGVYIPGWGGVRIEDMILVTKRGCKILT